MEPDPKYEDYEQVIQNGIPIGFKLKNDPFFYKYDQHGGWYDAEGKYFNKDAINCQPVYESDSEQEQEKGNVEEEDKALGKEMDSVNQRHQTIRELLHIVDSYPQGSLVHVEVDDENQELSDKDLEGLIADKKVEFEHFVAKVDKDTAAKLVRLQGKKVKNTTIYIYVKLYNSKQVSLKTKLTAKELQSQFQQVGLIKNKDFANIEPSQGLFTLEATPEAIQRMLQLKNKITVDVSA